MNRHHEMPFGAECRDDGSVRFRLWAPAARQVELHLDQSTSPIALNPLDNGWYELVTHAAKAGTKYQFQTCRPTR